MSTMEPDEGAQADDQQADAPRWDKVEAVNAADETDTGEPDAPRWDRADPGEGDGGADA
jgi:hypothetical protein